MEKPHLKLSNMEKNLNMGPNSPRVFSGETFSSTNHLLYAESAELFANIIKNYFKVGEKYTLADLGSAGGELMGNILSRLPDYIFDVTAIDVSETSIEINKIAKNKTVADLTTIPCKDKEFDLSIMRYVLQWNQLGDQAKIIKEIARVTRGIAIVQHGGADHINNEKWRNASKQMFSHQALSKLHRNFYFFSSCEEVEKIFKENNLAFERIQYRKVDGFSDVFIERFNLTEEESELVREILGNFNYIMQTAWILYFRN
jgi:ubiquinone/menaquinone biosynthesis C-methylase UbiE